MKKKVKITIETNGKEILLDLGKNPVPIYLILEIFGKSINHIANKLYEMEEENYQKMKGGSKKNGNKIKI